MNGFYAPFYKTITTMEEKNCAFQYAYTKGGIFRDTKIVCDKSAITLDEAKALFNSYKKEIIGILKNKDDYDSLEAVIWIDMKDEFSYGDTLIYITLDFDTDGTDIWEVKKEYIPKFINQ